MLCRDRDLLINSFQKIIVILLIIIINLLIVNCQISDAASQTEPKVYLDLEILQERIDNLVQQQGMDTINLSNYIINLTEGNNEFSQQFYQQINSKISRNNNPITLDLSNSIIQGDFQFNSLGISTAVAEGTISSLLAPDEREKVKQYYSLNSQQQRALQINVFRGSLNLTQTVFTGAANFASTLFLHNLTSSEAKFQEIANFNSSNFVKDIDFSGTIFNQNVDFSHTHFYSDAKFQQVQFLGVADFNNSQFDARVQFDESTFTQLADFTDSVFLQTANFSKTIWRDRVLFAKSKFLDAVIFTSAAFEKTVTFRDIYLNSLIDLQDGHLLNRVDFSNAFFTPNASINVSGLAFDTEEVKIIGETARIGNFIRVNRLEGNETVFRNLIRNFRSLEQIADANQLEYQREKLRLKQIGDRLINTSWKKILSFTCLSLIFHWLFLSLLLLLGNYGTNVNLLFSVGIITIAFFSLLFWFIDRYRPQINQPIIPSNYEIIWMLASYLILTSLSLINILITTERPWLTLACIAIVILPIPLTFTVRIYWQGRYHQLLDTTYFVEDGSMREFRLLIGRLPIIPRFPFYRDRYQPILWEKRWNWLNYYDFSFNNILKLGFNDIRLRDRHLPGIIATLVWYQWCLGGFYIILLLWTLSRTIPGLNLLIYF